MIPLVSSPNQKPGSAGRVWDGRDMAGWHEHRLSVMGGLCGWDHRGDGGAVGRWVGFPIPSCRLREHRRRTALRAVASAPAQLRLVA